MTMVHDSPPQPRATDQEVILAARTISKSYGEVRSRVLVLDDITLELRAGEVIDLLGPSGSGKSTLRRILAGSSPPWAGQVLVRGQPQHGANPQVALVFQSFALYPWLTEIGLSPPPAAGLEPQRSVSVLDNVERGLLAKETPPAERRR
jgi:NitT/TauT family transport system ATP-binding protein